MRHRATPRFWACYNALPAELRQLADRCYALLRQDPRHPSLHFKKVGQFWSVRVGLHYRALAVESGTDIVWVWIGSHADYDQLLSNAQLTSSGSYHTTRTSGLSGGGGSVWMMAAASSRS